MGKLSTHVLDTMHGKPAQGVLIRLYRLDNGSRELLKTAATNADGRCDEPLLQGETMQKGRYELVFAAGAYFAALGIHGGEPRFLDEIPIRFGIASADENYHVPLVMTPWTYATYRGS
ncbi:hydroxyisourate hydrolase [Uruburuella testudinis]|uniref:5-hydroxyisourate hydrolase n=1 Tax=Uruburuella testudinis TaxID=1282863 RepID=A0ABY4DQF5_9NEIS|nr:hydroxyisourate hydrolase [Uruburuella testudinis]UOO81289.1 hydroxyisourate hydrolase [Uruburuella testudinis]